MTIHPVQADTTAYDSVWAGRTEAATETPAPPADPLERVMLSNEKIYVVLAVVLIIWLGLVFLIFRTDRKLDRVERALEANISGRDE